MVQYELDGNTFVITNMAHKYSVLAQWGDTNARQMGTYDGQQNWDQLWILREDSNSKGYYTINNFFYTGSRVAKWSHKDGDTGNFNGNRADDQLWKFDQHGEENCYTITNLAYPKAKLAKWGPGNLDWGSYEGGFSNDQVWRLGSRFEAAKLRTQEVVHYKNNSSTEIKQTRKYTTGMTVTDSTSATNSSDLEMSLTTSASAGAGGMSASVSAGLKSTISQSLSKSSSVTSEWKEEVTTEYLIPPYTEYVVMQHILDYTGKVPADKIKVSITNLDVTETAIEH